MKLKEASLSESLRLFAAKFRHDVVDGLTTEQAADSALAYVRADFMEVLDRTKPELDAKGKEALWRPIAAVCDALRICLIGWPVHRGDGVIAWDAERFPECFSAADPTRNPDEPHPIPPSLKD